MIGNDGDESLDEAAAWLRGAEHVVVFTGAGISAESGIATFRDADGFWQRFPPDTFATWRGLVRTAALQPRRMAEFLLAVLEPIALAKPNPGHLAIERLEQFARVTVITQNIDDLHRDAGSTTVLPIHGSLLETVTRRGRFVALLSRHELHQIVNRLRGAEQGLFPRTRLAFAMRSLLGLGRRGLHRPRLVLFGDQLAEPEWSRAQAAAGDCDVFLTVGTSGVVFPAALLPSAARSGGAKIIGVDPNAQQGDVWLRGSAAEVLPRLVEAAFGDH